ncbi:hypothetical protein H2198_002614 [Neophaeococcomyces mojaviensis]|uniref:Uncharacterized protein n=1 Tax=Neophaeococcomyces mojaviensis TaxID=3383035 RepID=A0ACC3AE34_9EURO|nr:hypothetical protein H2198_002614 [Knufia sp. JES_112]
MAVTDLLSKTPLSAWAVLFILALVIYFTRIRFRSVLRTIPGPFIASFTNWWRLYDVSRGLHQETLVRLHREYASDLVRVGPNVVSVADPEAMKLIYGLNKGFSKSKFYHVQQNVSQGKPLENIFNTTREDFHAAIKRPVAHAYSMTSLVQYEPFVDTTSQLFCRKLAQEFAETGRVCDLGAWLQYYAFDVIGEITFSKKFGFLETGTDVQGIIADVEWRLGYFAVIGQIPPLDRFLLKSSLAMRMIPNNHVVKFTVQQVQERMAKPADRKDFLSAFLQAKKDYPELVSDRQVLSYSNSNIFAGSDTTAISLRSILYYMLKNPDILKKVVAEVDNTVGDRDCNQYPISYAESNRMPYFQAVLKEAMRMHPAVGLLLERTVPANGVTIAGKWLPGGTIVGICPWVLHRDKRVFGNDADVFRPERWLEASPETLKVMDRSNLAFGAGSRTCLGKHISLLEMCKVIPQLLWTFKFELAEPGKEWTLHNSWFVKQMDFNVYVKKRPEHSVHI